MSHRRWWQSVAPGVSPGISRISPEPARAGDSKLDQTRMPPFSIAPPGLGIIHVLTPGLCPGLNSSTCFAGSLSAHCLS